jgi:hypothetical protein
MFNRLGKGLCDKFVEGGETASEITREPVPCLQILGGVVRTHALPDAESTVRLALDSSCNITCGRQYES